MNLDELKKGVSDVLENGTEEQQEKFMMTGLNESVLFVAAAVAAQGGRFKAQVDLPSQDDARVLDRYTIVGIQEKNINQFQEEVEEDASTN